MISSNYHNQSIEDSNGQGSGSSSGVVDDDSQRHQNSNGMKYDSNQHVKETKL